MIIQTIINTMHSMDPLAIKALIFLFCMLFIIIFTKFFGQNGLYVYSTVAIITANIQVLKAAQIEPFTHPIALGSVVFTSLFLVSDIITELYGKSAAQKGIWLGFVASSMFSITMLLTIGIRPLDESYATFAEAHRSIAFLFTPSISILISSLLAYFISLWSEVHIFNAIKIVTGEKLLWLRSFVSSSIGIIIDNVIFSISAWVVFAVIEVPLNTVFYTYILGTLSMRMLLTIVSIPVFYWVKKIVQKSNVQIQ